MAVAEILRPYIPDGRISICNLAICGRTRLGEIARADVYAGMLPIMPADGLTAALSPLPGGEADPRQRYAEAYDNPAFILHLLGEDLVALDRLAQRIRAGVDRTSHIITEYGTINTLSVGPPRRIIRNNRPRYVLQLMIEAEYIRPAPTEDEPADTQPEETI